MYIHNAMAKLKTQSCSVMFISIHISKQVCRFLYGGMLRSLVDITTLHV